MVKEPTINKSPLAEASELSAEVLADMELGRIPNHQILLKCRRLARLVGDEIWSKWLELEIHGYNSPLVKLTDEERKGLFVYFGRELDSQKHTGLIHPLATLEQEVETAKLEMAACRVPSSIHASNSQTFIPDSASRAVNEVLFRLSEIRTTITQRQVIIGRVIGLAHSNTLKWYNELHYSDVAQSIFERRRLEVDTKLKDICPKALEQFVAAYERLRSGSEEDWSQALLSCRRILKSFADSVFPPRNDTYIGKNGKEHDVSEEKYLNRLLAFIDQNAKSRTSGEVFRAEVDYLGSAIEAIHDQSQKGVHAKVTRRDADSTVLLTYLLLADLLDLVDAPRKVVPEAVEPGSPSEDDSPPR